MQTTWIRIRNVTLSIVFTLGVLFFSSCTSMGVRKSADIEGAPISYVYTENCGPTVVFEAGWGGGLEAWKAVFKDVAVYTAAVAYTRSTKVNAEGIRSAEDVACALKALLETINTPKPYVLVGHSLGGLYVLRFAKLFPEDVVGVILVDGVAKGFVDDCQDAGLNCFPSESEIAKLPNHQAAEARGFEETEKQTPTPEELGDMPITVMAATEHGPKQAIWLRFQKEFADRLQNGRLVVAEGSNHNVQEDAPELVLREIRLMVDRVVGNGEVLE